MLLFGEMDVAMLLRFCFEKYDRMEEKDVRRIFCYGFG